MLFIEEASPPPFYQAQLSDAERTQLDKWFIGKRSQAYYLKRFAQFDKQGYLSPKWHWAAFFATFGWLLYRKRYLDSIVYTVAGWSFIQLNIVIALVAFESVFMSFVPDVYQMMVRIAIAGLIWLFWACMVARWADAYYYRMARREIADVVADYPKQPEKQKAHLQREGGVSVVGLSIAFAIFLFALLILQVQFLPIYAKPKEKGIIQTTYEWTKSSSYQIEMMYQQSGRCPVDAPLHINEKHFDLQIVEDSDFVLNKASPCMVVATMQNIPFPNRNLNNQTIVMYRESAEPKASWLCTTSLNEKQQPILCFGK